VSCKDKLLSEISLYLEFRLPRSSRIILQLSVFSCKPWTSTGGLVSLSYIWRTIPCLGNLKRCVKIAAIFLNAIRAPFRRHCAFTFCFFLFKPLKESSHFVDFRYGGPCPDDPGDIIGENFTISYVGRGCVLNGRAHVMRTMEIAQKVI